MALGVRVFVMVWAVCVCITTPAQAWPGIVTYVSDGDTVWVQPLHGGEAHKVRLLGIDAPEICQPWGPQSRAALHAALQGQVVEVRARTRDSYGRLLAQLTRQGNDVGTQYRSGIYFTTPKQESEARTLIQELTGETVFGHPIVTEVLPLARYSAAEDYHQDFFARNPHQGYCLAVAAPKVAKFRQTFSRLAR